VLLSIDGGDSATRTEVTEALARARTCELVARAAGTVRSDVAFTAGLLHGVATAIGVPPPRMPERLPSLSPELAAALTGEPGPLTDVLEAVLAYQRGDVAALRRSGLPLSLLSDAYLAALAWTTETSRAAGDPG
jgi:EAL and modified HD-GYP domain-containing signal transduction protein